jgi:predicted nucleotidyltransferase
VFEELLRKVGSELARSGIPYMVIGGQAVLLYGEPRLTRDIDITIGAGIEQLPVLTQSVINMGLKILPERFEEFAKTTYVLPAIDQLTGIRVDFIFSYTPYERAAIERAREIVLKETPIKFASVEDIIIHKVFAGRPRDIEDVRAIVIKNPTLNIQYVQRWLEVFDESSERGGFRKIFKQILADSGVE